MKYTEGAENRVYVGMERYIDEDLTEYTEVQLEGMAKQKLLYHHGRHYHDPNNRVYWDQQEQPWYRKPFTPNPDPPRTDLPDFEVEMMPLWANAS